MRQNANVSRHIRTVTQVTPKRCVVRRNLSSVALLLLLLSACDFTEDVAVVRPDGQPVLCSGGEQTSFEIAYRVLEHPYDKQEVAYEGKSQRLLVRPQWAFSTNPDRVMAGILRGSLRSGRVPWIQFHIYCGGSMMPFLVTPKLTTKDLKKDGNAYYYVVE